MEYGWHNLPNIYFTLSDGTLIGVNNYCKYFNENYSTYEKPWRLQIESPIGDFDLIDTLLSTPFNIYTKTIVRRRVDGANKTIWHKYSNVEIVNMERAVAVDGEPAVFIEFFDADEREQVHENSVPKEIREYKKGQG